MKTIAKKTVCLLLALLMILPLVVSCKKDDESGETDTNGEAVVGSEQESETESNKYEVYDDLGDIDLGGITVLIGQPNMDEYVHDVFVERMTGDVVNDAVYKRNAAVEKRLNCTIEQKLIGAVGASNWTILDDLEANAGTQSVSYDVVVNAMWTTAARLPRGYYKDLNSVQNLNLSKIYWGQYINEAYNMGGVQYMTSGVISLSYFKYMFATFVNDTILAQTTEEVPNLLKVVEDGEWTMGYQKTLAEKYYSKDRYGFATATAIQLDPYIASGQVKFLEKDANGWFNWAVDLNHLENVVTAAHDLVFGNTDAVYVGNHYFSETVTNSKTLMATVRLDTLETDEIRAMTDKYSIIPVPKYSTSQTDYYSTVHDAVSVVVVPVTVSEEKEYGVGAVLEAMSSESYREVAPAYYEVALKVKYTSNVDAYELLDYMVTHITMDAGVAFAGSLNIGGGTCLTKFRANVINPTVGSSFGDAAKNAMNTALNGETGLQTEIRNKMVG